jgi:hypothetical protein
MNKMKNILKAYNTAYLLLIELLGKTEDKQERRELIIELYKTELAIKRAINELQL